jgi:hypothetical protein
MTTDIRDFAPDVPAASPMDLRALRHPTEPLRLALAVVSLMSGAAVVVAAAAVIGPSQVLVVLGSVVLTFGSLWVGLQLYRVKILGDAVRVSAETFPDFQSAIEEVRDRLGYHQRVDVFVVPKLSPPVQVTSYFGIRVLEVEGAAVADITAHANRSQLIYLLGTYFGALKAKHTRSAPVAVLVGQLGLQRFLAPLLCPWLRATVYTGDRIAYACCRDLDVSLDATYRVLVGRELSPQLHAEGLIEQADHVRRSRILRLTQLFRPQPHATNRFLHLLHYASTADPDAVNRLRSALPPDASATLDAALVRAGRDNRRRAGVVVTACAVALVAGLMTYGVAAAGDVGVPESDPASSGLVTPEPGPVPEPEPTSVPEPQPAPVPEPERQPIPPSVVDVLLARVGSAMGDSCQELADVDELVDELVPGLLAAAECRPGSGDQPESLHVYAYQDAETLSDALRWHVGDIAEGPCLDGGLDTWSLAGETKGHLACYTTDTLSVVVWDYTDQGMLAVAADPVADAAWLFDWWELTPVVGALAGTGT